jgi:uncharacterized membrane protein
MNAVLGHPAFQAILSVLILLAVVAVGVRVLRRVRPATNKDHTNAADLARNFEEMHREGDISEAEFRTITSVLGKKLADGPQANGTSVT